MTAASISAITAPSPMSASPSRRRCLHAGRNSLTITMDSRNLTAYLMVDYLRLELSGYVPPSPDEGARDSGERPHLVSWSPVPGATSYVISRSLAGSSGYTPLASGIRGPLCGSGTGPAQYIDASVTNGSAYSYAIEAVNTEGKSGRSAPSPVSTPAKPSYRQVHLPRQQQLIVAQLRPPSGGIAWNAVAAATSYAIWRTTLHEDGVGGTIPSGHSSWMRRRRPVSSTHHPPTVEPMPIR